jgi:putative sigma-54 modulation protein
MQSKFTFKHLEPLTSITEYAQNRVAKLEKYALHKEPKVHFIFSVQKKEQVAEVLVDVGQFHFAATASEESLYSAIDRVVEKLEKQLMRHKEKIQSHKHYDVSNEGMLARQLEEETLALREQFLTDTAPKRNKRNVG